MHKSSQSFCTKNSLGEGMFGVAGKMPLGTPASHTTVPGLECWVSSKFQHPANTHPGRPQVMAQVATHMGDLGCVPSSWLSCPDQTHLKGFCGADAVAHRVKALA